MIARRLRDAVSDMSHWREFDYVVVNDDFERAVADLMAIMAAHGETVPPASSGGAQGLAAGRPELAPLLARLLA